MVYTGQISAKVRTYDDYIYYFDNNASGQPVYEGCAEPGTSTSVTSWKIKRYTYDGKGAILTILFAGGTKDFATAWSGRAAASYS